MNDFFLFSSTFTCYISKLSIYSPTWIGHLVQRANVIQVIHTRNASRFSIQFQYIAAAAQEMICEENGASLGILPGHEMDGQNINIYNLHQHCLAFVNSHSPKGEK